MLKGRGFFFFFLTLWISCVSKKRDKSCIFHPSLKYLKYHSVGALCTWGMLIWAQAPFVLLSLPVPTVSPCPLCVTGHSLVWFSPCAGMSPLAAPCCLHHCWPRNCNQMPTLPFLFHPPTPGTASGLALHPLPSPGAKSVFTPRDSPRFQPCR